MSNPDRDALKKFEAWLLPTTEAMVRGLLSMVFNMDPAAALVVICHCLGKMMGAMFRGDELNVRRFRKACTDAFCDACRDEPVRGQDEAPPKAETAAQ